MLIEYIGWNYINKWGAEHYFKCEHFPPHYSRFLSAGNYEEDGGIRSGSVFGSPNLTQNFSVSARMMDLLGVENMLRSPDLLQNFWCNQTKCKYFLPQY